MEQTQKVSSTGSVTSNTGYQKDFITQFIDKHIIEKLRRSHSAQKSPITTTAISSYFRYLQPSSNKQLKTTRQRPLLVISQIKIFANRRNEAFTHTQQRCPRLLVSC
ncbi:hypothetical protein SS50377_24923 [Spironucleus salmonicida]|uniref:Uncharacterized protein n=1 Tax=Spironucleus salmonicida TaxID=348837 RepID=A0A9P8RXA5_9EUKA|nr:hypothetical protein SS50377_24923 [Spironucleus salmonicida]